MSFAAPATVVTDYLLAISAAWFALDLGRRLSGSLRLWWCLTFITLALSAALGGTYHGLQQDLDVAHWLWLATLLTSILAGLGLFIAVAHVFLDDPARQLWSALACIKASVASIVAILAPHFAVVLVDFALTMAFVAALSAGRVRSSRAARYFLAGIGRSASGQQSSSSALLRIATSTTTICSMPCSSSATSCSTAAGEAPGAPALQRQPDACGESLTTAGGAGARRGSRAYRTAGRARERRPRLQPGHRLRCCGAALPP